MPDGTRRDKPKSPLDEPVDLVSSAAPDSPTEVVAKSDPPDASTYDPTGLEVARFVAGGLRGAVRKRAGDTNRGSRTVRDTQLSGAHPDARDPTPVGAAVDKVVADCGWTTDVAVHGVFGRWAWIVGTDVASHCQPESFQDGQLTVRTDSTSWATALRLLAPTVVRRMNEELGHGTVSRIEILGPQAPSWRKGLRTVRGRGPRDTYG
ncbi:MAG: DUF721 domain-containing protein [Nocardioidaceae bacterium]